MLADGRWPMDSKGERITFPTIHLNGTAAVDLIEALEKAHSALRDAQNAIKKTYPNGRDYYVQGPDAIRIAVDEYWSRLIRIEAVQKEIMAIWENVQSQEDERQARKAEALRR